MVMTADVAVIGGGIQGCSTALHLAKRGYKVIQVEKNNPGRHASGVNAGGVRRLLRDKAEIPLSCASMEIWHHIQDLVDSDCGFQLSPQLAVAESEGDMKQLEQRAAEVRALGYNHEELVDRNELRELAPALSPHCIGGLISRDDGFANPYQTTRAFWNAAIARGVRAISECRATKVVRDKGTWRIETSAGEIQSKILVNCAGAWSGALAAQMGEQVPIETVAPMMMVTSRMLPFLKQVIIGISRKLSFKQMPNGTVVIGGGHLGRGHLDTEKTDLDFSLLANSAKTVFDLFPVMRDATVVRAWSGIESRMPDDIPVIGPSSTQENAYHAFGFSMHGFQLGPITGAIIAELIDTGSTNLPIEPFSINRFRH